MPSRGLTLVAVVRSSPARASSPRRRRRAQSRRKPAALRGLDPGAFVVQKQRVPIEIVLIGFPGKSVKKQPTS